jgi:hypothetical protein
MMTVLFNAPSCVIGAIFGMIVGGVIVENSQDSQDRKAQVEHANQLITTCEAMLPRNLRCELTAKVVE